MNVSAPPLPYGDLPTFTVNILPVTSSTPNTFPSVQCAGSVVLGYVWRVLWLSWAHVIVNEPVAIPIQEFAFIIALVAALTQVWA